jgi:hypothetical protein
VKTLASFLFCALCLTAQPVDKGKQAVEDAVVALGGERFLQMQNRTESGRAYSFYNEELAGLDIATIYTEYLPSKPEDGVAIRERQVFGKKQDYSVLFLSDQGWDVTFRGARPIPDQNLKRYLNSTRNNILYLLRVRYKEPGMEFDYVGRDVMQNVEVLLVDITDALGQVVHVVFDKITKLPIRQTFSYLDPETKVRTDETTEFGNYRQVGDGIQWPFSIRRERNGLKVYELYANKIQVNQALPPKIFDLPPGVKILNKMNN